jgi:hypothetical protein
MLKQLVISTNVSKQPEKQLPALGDGVFSDMESAVFAAKKAQGKLVELGITKREEMIEAAQAGSSQRSS